MIERRQFDMGLESQRVSAMMNQGFGREERKTYAETEIISDIGERLDRAEYHYTYEMKNGKMYGQGFHEPFIDVMERGILQQWEGSRENCELIGYKFIQSYLADPTTPDGAMIFNPSPPDGHNYQKNYIDVYRKVGDQVHTVRYRSHISNEEYREKIIQLNPGYKEVILPNPKDTDFFSNPVIVPGHLNLNPDSLAEFVLGGKKGMDEAEFERIISENVWLITSTVNTLVDNPKAFHLHETNQKALYAGVRKSKDGESIPIFTSQRMQIQYLSEQKETLGGGGCGSGSSSANSSSSSVPSSELDNLDGRGDIHFRCPECGAVNKRELFQYVTHCQNKKCGSDKVLPPNLRGKVFQPGQAMKQ